SFGIFEIGHVVEGLCDDGTCNELNKLGAVLFSKNKSEEQLFMRAAETVRELVSDILHKDTEFVSVDAVYDFAHPVNCFDINVCGVKVGYLSVPHPTVLANIDKKCAIAFFEIRTDSFASVNAGTTAYKEPSKFPAIDIDITFTADIDRVVFSKLASAARSAAGEMLADVKAHDVYEADGVSSLTLRFSFVSNERTLTKQELSPAIEAIVTEFAKLGLTMKN
ncbi:MAG: hypothetical protein IKB23_05810, partial [Clostridia bacterium]|nr:hypothetical protein [Clostridia bacterium]